jgi:hypothetical protein
MKGTSNGSDKKETQAPKKPFFSFFSKSKAPKVHKVSTIYINEIEVPKEDIAKSKVAIEPEVKNTPTVNRSNLAKDNKKNAPNAAIPKKKDLGTEDRSNKDNPSKNRASTNDFRLETFGKKNVASDVETDLFKKGAFNSKASTTNDEFVAPFSNKTNYVANTADINKAVNTVIDQIFDETVANNYDPQGNLKKGVTAQGIAAYFKEAYEQRRDDGAFNFTYPKNTPPFLKEIFGNALEIAISAISQQISSIEKIELDKESPIEKLKIENYTNASLRKTVDTKLIRVSNNNNFDMALQYYALRDYGNPRYTLEKIDKDAADKDIQRSRFDSLTQDIRSQFGGNFKSTKADDSSKEVKIGEVVGSHINSRFPLAFADSDNFIRISVFCLNKQKKNTLSKRGKELLHRWNSNEHLKPADSQALTTELANATKKFMLPKFAQYAKNINEGKEPFDSKNKFDTSFAEELLKMHLAAEKYYSEVLDSEFYNVFTGANARDKMSAKERSDAQATLKRISRNTETYTTKVLGANRVAQLRTAAGLNAVSLDISIGRVSELQSGGSTSHEASGKNTKTIKKKVQVSDSSSSEDEIRIGKPKPTASTEDAGKKQPAPVPEPTKELIYQSPNPEKVFPDAKRRATALTAKEIQSATTASKEQDKKSPVQSKTTQLDKKIGDVFGDKLSKTLKENFPFAIKSENALQSIKKFMDDNDISPEKAGSSHLFFKEILETHYVEKNKLENFLSKEGFSDEAKARLEEKSKTSFNLDLYVTLKNNFPFAVRNLDDIKSIKQFLNDNKIPNNKDALNNIDLLNEVYARHTIEEINCSKELGKTAKLIEISNRATEAFAVLLEQAKCKLVSIENTHANLENIPNTPSNPISTEKFAIPDTEPEQVQAVARKITIERKLVDLTHKNNPNLKPEGKGKATEIYKSKPLNKPVDLTQQEVTTTFWTKYKADLAERRKSQTKTP